MKDVNILTNNGVNVEQSLELFGDMEMYDETLQDFLDMVEEKLASLEKHKETSDMANYAIEVHSLKSDARYLGFTTLADMSYDSELKSKAGDVMYVQENHPKIIAEAKRMINVGKQYLGLIPVEVTPAPAEVPTQMPAVESAPVVAPTPMPAVEPAPVAAPAPMPAVEPAPAVAPTPMPAVEPAPVVAPAPMPAVEPAPVVAPTQMPAVEPAPVVAPTPMPAVEPAPVAAPAPMPAVESATNTINIEPQVEGIESNTVQFFPLENSQNNTVQFFPSNAPATSASSQVNMGQASGEKQGTILVVDDSNLVVNFVKKIFESKYEVVTASDGAEAITLVDDPEFRKKVKACLLDLNMPNVDGYAVLEHFKQNGYFVKMPVAVESGVEDMQSIERANNYPIVDVLSKPFNERDVQRVIEKCLATYF